MNSNAWYMPHPVNLIGICVPDNPSKQDNGAGGLYLSPSRILSLSHSSARPQFDVPVILYLFPLPSKSPQTQSTLLIVFCCSWGCSTQEQQSNTTSSTIRTWHARARTHTHTHTRSPLGFRYGPVWRRSGGEYLGVPVSHPRLQLNLQVEEPDAAPPPPPLSPGSVAATTDSLTPDFFGYGISARRGQYKRRQRHQTRQWYRWGSPGWHACAPGVEQQQHSSCTYLVSAAGILEHDRCYQRRQWYRCGSLVILYVFPLPSNSPRQRVLVDCLMLLLRMQQSNTTSSTC